MKLYKSQLSKMIRRILRENNIGDSGLAAYLKEESIEYKTLFRKWSNYLENMENHEDEATRQLLLPLKNIIGYAIRSVMDPNVMTNNYNPSDFHPDRDAPYGDGSALKTMLVELHNTIHMLLREKDRYGRTIYKNDPFDEYNKIISIFANSRDSVNFFKPLEDITIFMQQGTGQQVRYDLELDHDNQRIRKRPRITGSDYRNVPSVNVFKKVGENIHSMSIKEYPRDKGV